MKLANYTRIRLGLIVLVSASVLGIVGLGLRGPLPLPGLDADAWALSVTDPNYVTAQMIIIFAYVLPYLGFWGLYACLSTIKKIERIAFWGFMCSIIGTSFALPMLGIVSFVNPQLGIFYLQGDHQFLDVINNVMTGWPLAINVLGGVVYLFGMGLLGLAVFTSSAINKWIGILLGLHGLFLVFGFALFPLLILSWVILFLATLWLMVETSEKNQKSHI